MAYNQEHGKVFVYDTYNLMFLTIPKMASIAIHRSIYNKEIFDLPIYAQNYHHIPKDNIERYRKFAVVRNPLDRFVSGYIEVCRRNVFPKGKRPNYGLFMRHEDPERRFLEFFDTIKKYGLFDAHIETQDYYFTNNGRNKIQIDRYLRFEYLKQDFRKMMTDFKLGIELMSKEEWKEQKSYPSAYPGEKELLYDIIDRRGLEEYLNRIYKKDWLLFNKINNIQ